ncbi:GNAT family N-acetyltransferase [Pseudonocardia humida]|uniref:GNAT family N-acetyltransferase n=1 Tax=Pseudonocardia humida TaxID=2800819 RepID=A0ABT0ZWB8_9PSEU|nr:GNAT family N-acetyltransferase [Pseudonocardia humida]MCO1655037.1 GNAT family N-acetyltransferase [Pseudonocardia humida]
MDVPIRELAGGDHEPVVALSLRAWAPVFASMEAVLGPSGVFERFYPDWRVAQRAAVLAACTDAATLVWVAEVGGAVAGFVAVRLDRAEGLGEIHMVAVDPDHQRRGVGSALTAFALDRIREAGMSVAMVETGGDPGHGPARRTYERAGFTAMPVVRYFAAL